MNIFSTLLVAITAACNAYASYISYEREKEIDILEDEIDRLTAIGDAASELRLERLAIRLKRKKDESKQPL